MEPGKPHNLGYDYQLIARRTASANSDPIEAFSSDPESNPDMFYCLDPSWQKPPRSNSEHSVNERRTGGRLIGYLFVYVCL